MHRLFLHLDSRTLAYFDSAPADHSARVAVLVHAFPLAASMWEPQLKATKTGWRLLAIDLRGFGGSTSPPSEEMPSIDDYASDVVDLLRALDIASAVVGGLSMGGYVTFAMLRQAATMIRALVLADTRAGADSLEARGNRRNLLALLDREGAPGVARDMVPKLLGKTTRDERPEVELAVRGLIRQQSTSAIRDAILRIMQRPDSRALLSEVAVPTLVLVGEEDGLVSVEEARDLASAIPNAELVRVPRAGHLANLEQPVAFNDALWNFLSRL